MAVICGLAAFVAGSLGARFYRLRTGVWVPGWTGGISLLALFAVAFVAAIALGAPAWFELLFFVAVGAHIGAYTQLARTKFEGRVWELWR